MTAATNPPSPPSARDFNVYEHVAVEGNTTRQAAERFKISQTRVCQVIRKVAAFAGAVLPGILETEIPEPQRLVVSKNVAALRLDHLYQQSMAAWRRSGGETWRVRESKGGCDVVRTTWKERRKIAYLDQAMKISRQAMEMELPLPMSMLAVGDEADDADGQLAANAAADELPAAEQNGDQSTATERMAALAKLEQLVKAVGRLHEDLQEYDRRNSTNPPSGDCSEKAAAPPAAEAPPAAATAQEPAPQPETAAASAAVAAPASAPPTLFKGPAALADWPIAEPPVAAASVSPAALFTDPAPLKLPLPPRIEGERLSRRQRRKRMRQAAELLRHRRSLAAVG